MQTNHLLQNEQINYPWSTFTLRQTHAIHAHHLEVLDDNSLPYLDFYRYYRDYLFNLLIGNNAHILLSPLALKISR